MSTKAAYYDVVGARETRLVAEANVGLAKSALAGVHRQVEVGVATKADESLAQSAALNAELAYRQLARAEDIGKQGLAAFLSLGVDLRSVDLTDALPDIDVVDQTEDSLVARSQACRLDVRSARHQVEFAEEQVRLEQSRTIPAASVGIAAERPESGSSTEFLAGVVGSVEIPLFDQNQAQVSRAKYRRDALKKELEALSAEVTAQVRAALDRWTTAQGAAAFAERDVLPQAERNATLARRAYDLGDKTVLAMLASQSLVVQARQNVTNARLEAARALLDLERSIGAPLGVPLRQGNAKPLDRPPE